MEDNGSVSPAESTYSRAGTHGRGSYDRVFASASKAIDLGP